ncbi:MAG: tetratricopeptide repeat protein [Terracidiphilus sp.]
MDTNNSLHKQWTTQGALILMAVCLMAGVAGGWAIRGARRTAETDSARSANAPQPATTSASAAQTPGPTRLKSMADNQAGPMILRLKTEPKNTDLLVNIGNLYYDAQEYRLAVDYYRRALQIKPSDAAVRTDMATAYWYLGEADTAIAEFNKALTYAPTNPSTLFNLGLVKWQGKHDSAGAIADWKKLLATNPNYEARDKVQQMLTDVEKQTATNSAAKG